MIAEVFDSDSVGSGIFNSVQVEFTVEVVEAGTSDESESDFEIGGISFEFLFYNVKVDKKVEARPELRIKSISSSGLVELEFTEPMMNL